VRAFDERALDEEFRVWKRLEHKRGWVQRAWRGPHGRGTCARARVHNYRALLSRGNHMEEEHALNIWLSSCALCFFWTLVTRVEWSMECRRGHQLQ